MTNNHDKKLVDRQDANVRACCEAAITSLQIQCENARRRLRDEPNAGLALLAVMHALSTGQNNASMSLQSAVVYLADTAAMMREHLTKE